MYVKDPFHITNTNCNNEIDIKFLKYNQAWFLFLPYHFLLKNCGKICLTLAKKYENTLGRFFAMKPAFFFNSLSNSHKLVISIPHSNDLLQNSLLQNQTTKIRRCSLGKIRKATVSSRRKVFLRSKSRAYFNVLFCKKRQL